MDSRSEPTLEVEITSATGIKEKASVPSGRSKGKFEAKSIKPDEAITKLNTIIPELKSRDFKNISDFDSVLLELDG
ncbi:MAG: phosphopyruvate hydratase, partial [Candidatus Paceibacteria bacterium]